MNLTQLGRFQIIRQIGRGAMGQVFLARDPKIDRQIAIKTIVHPPGISPEEAQETSRRFLREAQAAGKLLHPNIVTIFDVGEEEGVSFIAMEFIEGETLEKHARPDSLLPLRRVQELISQAASALDYAHDHGIIHRDVKPANLMVLKGWVLKVTDFGLAKSPQANLTQAGVLLGTPSYMSPEQIQGRDLDGRSDLFSLGVVLYELLTGVRPFEGDSISTIIYRVLYEDPRPPAAHNAALPPEVNGILERALAKDPSERYQRGSDLVADLSRAFAGLPPETLAQGFPRPASPKSTERAGAAVPPTLRKGGRGAGRRAGPPGQAAGPAALRDAAAAAKGRPAFVARHPLKFAAIIGTAALGLVMFPKRADRHDLPGGPDPFPAPAIGASGGGLTPASVGGADGGPGLAAPPAAAALARGAVGRQVVIDVATVPHGGAIFLDSTPLLEPKVVLSLSDPKPHEIVAQAGCRYAVAEMTASDLASFKGPLVLELAPRKADVPIASEPPNARILLNGRDTGKLTPAVLTLAGCEERRIVLEREGYRPWKGGYDADDDFDAMVEALKKVSLEPIPAGSLLVKRSPEYDVDIYAGDARIGRAGEVISLKEGKHSLTFRNDKLFVHETAKVTVAAGKTTTPVVTLPALGSLTVHAQPSNCKVYVDGVYVDVTPILDLPIASGGHRVKVVFVPNGAEREIAVTVDGRKNSLVTVKF
ncbi:MAG: serine/threonine protein kinase [Acidobacteria bacterium]|nr:serine/threonine protein kinase [Acidobacteriota bacterium]